MSESIPVLVPLLNPNEPESRLTAIHAPEGTRVVSGQLLVSLETTKSSVEVTAEAAGFVTGLRASVGDLLRAGDRLCWLALKPDWNPPQVESPAAEATLPEGLRLTAPALGWRGCMALTRPDRAADHGSPGARSALRLRTRNRIAGRSEADRVRGRRARQVRD
jgi:pyruvate/2-oxoglutarate dehydrogenase complex dihydrolipoamide acyltransferase (E2) component